MSTKDVNFFTFQLKKAADVFRISHQVGFVILEKQMQDVRTSFRFGSVRSDAATYMLNTPNVRDPDGQQTEALYFPSFASSSTSCRPRLLHLFISSVGPPSLFCPSLLSSSRLPLSSLVSSSSLWPVRHSDSSGRDKVPMAALKAPPGEPLIHHPRRPWRGRGDGWRDRWDNRNRDSSPVE